MSVLTEAALRLLLKDEDLDALQQYRVEAGVIVTPSAKAYLSDHKIDLMVGDKCILRNPTSSTPSVVSNSTSALPTLEKPSTQSDNGSLPHFEKPLRFQCLGGGFVDEKPENMTALRGNLLVPKDHKRIVLRGQFDSMDASILEVQFALRAAGYSTIVEELEESRTYLKRLLRCEVMEEPVPEITLLGLSDSEIREHSHHPRKHYGIQHFAADLNDNEAVIRLNTLRTKIREIELIAYTTFKGEDGVPQRLDMIQALNRLSSVFYIMMVRAKAAGGEKR